LCACTVELLQHGFGEEPAFKVILAELNSAPPTEDARDSQSPPESGAEKNERLVGYALYCAVFSSWHGLVLRMEDLFIRPQFRSEFSRA
jgi:hypothetical protein